MHAAATAHETFLAFRDIPSLVRERNELAAENQKLQAALADTQDVMHENELLRAELSLPQPERDRQGIAAFIVGRSSTGAFGTFTINRGQRDGVREGQVVLSQGVLVGQISEVLEQTSFLIPLTNVNSAIPVVFAESRGIGVLRGGVRGLTVEEVARDVAILPGEAVVTSNLGGIVPQGIFVGTVESVVGNPADVFQSVTVRSPVPFNWIELVVVMEQ